MVEPRIYCAACNQRRAHRPDSFSLLFRVLLNFAHNAQTCSPKIILWVIFGWLCWGLTSQSTIFQSCRDGAIASWVINQYFRGVKCLAQGHNTAAVGLEPRTSRSGVRHSTTEPLRSPSMSEKLVVLKIVNFLTINYVIVLSSVLFEYGTVICINTIDNIL